MTLATRDRGHAASGLIRVAHDWRAETVEILSIHKEESPSPQKQPKTAARAQAGCVVTSLGGCQTQAEQPGLNSKLALLWAGFGLDISHGSVLSYSVNL